LPPGGGRFVLNTSHDKACVLSTMDELLAAMLAHGSNGTPVVSLLGGGSALSARQ
jgi:hypothetical protein